MTESDHCGWEAVKVNFEYTAAEDYDGLGCNFAAQCVRELRCVQVSTFPAARLWL